MVYASDEGRQECFSAMIRAKKISTCHEVVDSVIHQCGLVEEVHQSRAPISEAIVYKKLARVPQDVPGHEDELMAKILNKRALRAGL
jgi:hypothetical protein